jgi:hypothetical protein
MNIGVGINENVVIAKASIEDKGWLCIELAPAEKAGSAAKSLFEELGTAGVQDAPSGSRQMLFDPKVPERLNKKGETVPDEKRRELVGNSIRGVRNQLVQICEQYMVQDAIDFIKPDIMYANTGISDPESFNARILDQEVVSKVYNNMVKRFVELMKPFLNQKEYAVRFRLARQSKDKHYPSIPERAIGDYPFIELMSVPQAQSKVKFSPYELTNKLDDGTPISMLATEAKADGTPVTATNAANVPVVSNPFAHQ